MKKLDVDHAEDMAAGRTQQIRWDVSEPVSLASGEASSSST